MLCPESLPSAGFGTVRAEHYEPEALGAGRWGPVSLEHVVGFCQELHGKLEAGGGVAVYSSERKGMQANVALLVGAYLVLQLGFSAEEAGQCLPPRATKQRFPQPWAENPRIHDNSLTVAGCLQGLAIANKRGWVHYSSFSQCGWRSNLAEFDATAVCRIPLSKHTRGGAALEVWAMADPVTTVADPRVRPPPPEDGFISDYSQVQQSRCMAQTFTTPCKDTAKPRRLDAVRRAMSSAPDGGAQPRAPRPRMRRGTWLLGQRVHHWSQQEFAKRGLASKRQTLATMPEFAGWLQARRCRALVRLNYSDEKRLPPCGSYGDYFSQWRIPQRGFEFQDCTVPSDEVVSAFAEFMDKLCDEAELDLSEPGGSVMVHCAAGLGRTMTLLGTYAARRLGVPGPAWIGWARMCRPGSVQTMGQEQFLSACMPTSGGGGWEAEGCRCFGRLTLKSGAPAPPLAAGRAFEAEDREPKPEEPRTASHGQSAHKGAEQGMESSPTLLSGGSGIRSEGEEGKPATGGKHPPRSGTKLSMASLSTHGSAGSGMGSEGAESLCES